MTCSKNSDAPCHGFWQPLLYHWPRAAWSCSWIFVQAPPIQTLSSAVHLLAAALFLTLRPLPPVKAALPEEHQDVFRYALRSGVLPIASLFSDWRHEVARQAAAQILALRVLPTGTVLAILPDVYGIYLDPEGRHFFLSCAAATTAFAAAAFTLSAVRLKTLAS
jgi:hypothetical protein